MTQETADLTERRAFVTRFTDIYGQAITFMQMRRGRLAALDLALAAATAAAKYIAECHPSFWPTFVGYVANLAPTKEAA